jgi:hypothetical protein
MAEWDDQPLSPGNNSHDPIGAEPVTQDNPTSIFRRLIDLFLDQICHFLGCPVETLVEASNFYTSVPA